MNNISSAIWSQMKKINICLRRSCILYALNDNDENSVNSINIYIKYKYRTYKLMRERERYGA